MATQEYVMPKLAMAMNEGTINEWLVKDGQRVEKGEQIATVETEKVAYDLEAPQGGFFRITVPSGETVPVEMPIGLFADSEEELMALGGACAAAPAANNGNTVAEEEKSAVDNGNAGGAEEPAAAAVPTPSLQTITQGHTLYRDRIIASPLAKKMARDRGLDLAFVEGTGPNNRILKRDILRAEATGEGRAPLVNSAGSDELVARARIPVAGMRRAIARNMMSQMQNTATIAQTTEADVTDLLTLRKQFVARAEQLGTKVSVNAFFIKAIACAAKQYPILNASMNDDEIIVWDNVNVAFALALPSGDGFTENLMVPVIRNADRLGVVEIDKEMKRLIAKGHDGTLNATDMADSTITFTTTAGIAPPGTGGQAILNGQNVCIVGIGGAKKKPAEHNDEIKLRQLAPVMVNYDHRVVDGAPAGRFLNHLWECLQDPALMLA